MKLISITTPCYNEEANVEELYLRVRAVMRALGRYRYEHIFIDNASTDQTVAVLKRLAAHDPSVRLIVNARNFGPVRSSTHAFFEARGDAVIGVVADLQDPPELIPQLIEAWEQGSSMVLAVKRSSQEHPAMYWLRKQYYRLVNRLSSIETYENFTGFGLYDRRVVDILKSFNDPYPYFRGMIADIGLPHTKLYYDQPRRRRGVTSNTFYSLYDIGVLGLINHSKIPLRLMVFTGCTGSFVSFLVAMLYTAYKLLYWKSFSLGVAPIVIGNFFIFSVQLLFLGVIGEYVGAIHTQVQKRPLVVERERTNFDQPPTRATYPTAIDDAGASSQKQRIRPTGWPSSDGIESGITAADLASRQSSGEAPPSLPATH